MPLSETTVKTVEATAAAVAGGGVELTRVFYERMLANNPLLLDIFNPAHQRTLTQPKALLDAVVAYALNIRKINDMYTKREAGQPVAAELAELQGFFSVAERIAQKHTSFNIQPEQYQIVGSNLLATIKERITQDEAVLAEWGKAYEFLANLLIKRERELYGMTSARAGGWKPTRSFKVAEKEKLGDRVCRFRLVPVDGAAVMEHKPGQYLAIFARNPHFFPHQEIRQYSIVSAPNTQHYEIVVRRHDKGVLSPYLVDHVKVGDVLELAPPCGDFYLHYNSDAAMAAKEEKLTSPEFLRLQHSAFDFGKNPRTPLVFVSGGVGQDPLLSMLRYLAKQESGSARPLYWVHAAHCSSARVFKAEVAELKAKHLPTLKTFTFLSEITKADRSGDDYDAVGRIDLAAVPDLLALEQEKKAPHFFFCGPPGFMAAVEKQLVAKAVPGERMHFEMFAPFKALE